MNRMTYTLLLAVLSLSFSTHAASYKFNNINSDDMKNITKEFSANFLHTTVSGASSLGEIFGFELGVIGGKTATPKLGALAEEVSPGTKADPSYDAALIGQLSVPFGLTVEASLVPKIGTEDYKFSNFGLGVKWTLTDTVLADLPLSLALRGMLTRTAIATHQKVGAVDQSVDYKDSQLGLGVVVSKNLGIVEPYATLGLVRARGELSGAAVFNGDLAGTTSATEKTSSTYFGAGVELKLLVIRLGAEFQHLYDTNRFAGKLSFYF